MRRRAIAAKPSPQQMPLGEVLFDWGRHLERVYFPTTSIISLLYVRENGASAEIAVVGSGSVVGVSIFMGGETTPNSCCSRPASG